MAEIKIGDNFVRVQVECIGTPTEYKVSEDSTFDNISWVPFNNGDLIVDYPMTDFRDYTIYFQIRSSVMESNVKAITVEHVDQFIPINLKAVVLDGGSEFTEKTDIPIVLQYDGTPIYYKISIGSSGVAPNWANLPQQPFYNFPSTIKAPENSSSIVAWVQIIDERNNTSNNSDHINYVKNEPPVLLDVNYPSTTTEQVVEIQPIYSGLPTQYSCELTGDPDVWRAFDVNIKLIELIMTIDGANDYVLKLRNEYGTSNSISFEITYYAPDFNVSNLIINNGDAYTEETNLLLTFDVVGLENVTDVRVSLQENQIPNLPWVTYSGQPLSFDIGQQDSSGLITVYLQARSNQGNISSVVNDNIEYVIPNTIICRVMAQNNKVGTDKYAYENGFYTYSRVQYGNRFEMWDYHSGERLTDWNIMNDSETEVEFGGAGKGFGNVASNVFLEDSPYNQYFRYYGNIDRPTAYWGCWVPNGKYSLQMLISSSADEGYLDEFDRKLIINGTEVVLPHKAMLNNTEFVQLGTFEVTDGKLKITWYVLDNKAFGFNGINIEKVDQPNQLTTDNGDNLITDNGDNLIN